MTGPALLLDLLLASVAIATPLALAAIGEAVLERSGVVNLGIEGAMLFGALGGAIGSSVAGPGVGLAAGALAGLLVAALFAAVAMGAGADQIITGTAVTLASVGLTGTIAREYFGPAGAGLSIPTLAPAVPTALAVVAAALAWAFLFRTRTGLALRAAGEDAEAARAAGVPVRALRAGAALAGGALAGVAGATLVLAQVGTFTERMTAGRGFIAIAIVVLGRWNPVGALAASLLFGAATAAQFAFQAAGVAVPYQLFLMLPYLLALAVLAGGWGKQAGRLTY